MPQWRGWRLGALALSVGLLGSIAFADAPLAPVELGAAFGARSPWRLVVTQGPTTEDYAGFPAPGAVSLCLAPRPGAPCSADPDLMPPQDAASGQGWEPHYLNAARPVYPRGRSGPPLLLIATASLHAGDGGQLVATQLFRYDRGRDAFERVYAHNTGTNNNEEVRFIAAGPLMGDVISAEPTPTAPYGYWIEVNAPTPAYAYKQVLRYRSATHYGDGNPLAVIDSEMPNIEQRLGLWRPGAPLPLPAGPCPKPHLVAKALWCK